MNIEFLEAGAIKAKLDRYMTGARPISLGRSLGSAP